MRGCRYERYPLKGHPLKSGFRIQLNEFRSTSLKSPPETEAALLCQEWKAPARSLSDKEHAFIAFTEQFAMSVSTMSRGQVERLLDFASPDEVYAFVHALYVHDMRLRLEIVAREVLS